MDMIQLLAVLVAASSAPAEASAQADPIVCQSSKEHVVGTRVKAKPVCKRKSEWKLEQKQTQRELRQIGDRWKDPGRADSGR